MAYFGIAASSAGLRAARPSEDLATGLAARLARMPRAAPVVILVHGYKFDPALARSDPHRSLFAFEPEATCRKIRSWPRGLGFEDDAGETGLCIGFGWPAAAGHVASLVASGRTGFATVYHRAEQYGQRLAEVIALIERLSPGRTVDVVAHSLGARVALGALAHVASAPGRIVLLGAAEFDARAHEALGAMRAPCAPRIYNVTARANDVYDAMFETFAPRRSWTDRAIGHGLGADLPFWLDLQIDRADVTAWINSQGIPLTASEVRFCHWSFYTRRGAFELYRAILQRQPGWDIPSLRRAPCFSGQEPRWSRVRPRLRLPAIGAAAPITLDGDLRNA
jgi:pimeloyl-ACP methyl ester carboxylesterase